MLIIFKFFLMDLKSNQPFWLLKNGIITSYPSLKEDLECEVLIVGSGITGSLLAYQMVSEGYNTVLIDKREICTGSSSATTSMLQYEIDIPLFKLQKQIGEVGANLSYKACGKAIDDLEEICEKINSKAGFHRKNSIYFASTKKDSSWLKKEFEARRKIGFDVEWLSSEEISKKYNLQHTYGGILSTQGASVDAFRLAHELLRYATEKGLKIFDKTEMINFRSRKHFNELTTATKNTIKAQKVIFCVGYESVDLIKEKFVNLKSTFAVVSEENLMKFSHLDETLFWNTDQPYLYMRTTQNGRLLIGGGDENFSNPQKRDRLLEKKEQSILKNLKKWSPKIDFTPDFSWAGTFGETKDGLPYIGTHKKFPNSYFVLGFGGNGITFSVAGMKMASAYLKNQTHPLSEYFKFKR